MAGMAETGVPWLVVLPLSAFMIRSALIYPRFQRDRRKNLVKLAMLQPLVDAEISVENLKKDWSKPSRFVGLDFYVQRQHRRKIARLRNRIQDRFEREFKAPTYRWASKIVPVLILLTVSEGVRRLCGAHSGLLTILTGPFHPYIAWAAEPVVDLVSRLVSFSTKSESQPEAQSEHDLEHLDGTSAGATDHQSNLLESPASTSGTESLFGTFLEQKIDFLTSSWAQDSMRTAGFAWCKDLTATDPYKILPFLFSGTFFASIWFSPGATDAGNFYSEQQNSATSTHDTPAKAKPKRTFWQKVFLGLSAVSVFPAMTMPCAMLWYFIGNIAVSRIQMARLVQRYPIHPPPAACTRRPMMSSKLDQLNMKKTVSETPWDRMNRFPSWKRKANAKKMKGV
ncbi:hypothetical protein ANO11243_009480 [Dothideomycetidae sp. 11243]|nr:hypothetical protein ANO11243_009480 [fungal sp. No.11243]